MDALHNNFGKLGPCPQSREPETSVFVLIADEWNRDIRQFVSKATRPKLPGGLLLSPGLFCLFVQCKGERDDPK